MDVVDWIQTMGLALMAIWGLVHVRETERREAMDEIKREIPRKGLFGMFDRLCEPRPICRACGGPAPLRGVDEKGCNCWVRDRPAEERFSIRYGAHDVRCPAWAPSLDPVDAAHDAELRLRLDR